MELFYDMTRLTEDRLAAIAGRKKIPFFQESYALDTTMKYMRNQTTEVLKENPQVPFSVFSSLLELPHPIMSRIKERIGEVDSVRSLLIQLNANIALLNDDVFRELDCNELKYTYWVEYCTARNKQSTPRYPHRQRTTIYPQGEITCHKL